MITAAVCTIGDEILIGQIVDTNSSHLARALGEIGVRVTAMTSIPDDGDRIVGDLAAALAANDIVIATGGLGPTKDDITKPALTRLWGREGWYEHEGQKARVVSILHSRGLDVLDVNLQQAVVPQGCDVIENKLGTAPVMVFRFDAARFGHPATLYSLPGVPYEALGAIPDILADIRAHYPLDAICHKTLMTYGLAESALAKKIEAWEDALPPQLHLAYLPNQLTGVRLRLSAYGMEEEAAESLIEAQMRALRPLLGSYLYSERDDTLQAVIGRILRGTGKTLCAAESATGGMISHLITSVSGSSEYYKGSVTSYAAEVKCKLLGVKEEIIKEKGIVSKEVASQMAEGVRKLMGCTYALATTGWADKTGDEFEPAGTVWVAVSGPEGTRTARFQYKNGRERNIERFAASALNELRLYLDNEGQLIDKEPTKQKSLVC